MHDTIGFIDEGEIVRVLAAPTSKDAGQVRAVLAKARGLAGLGMEDVATLAAVNSLVPPTVCVVTWPRNVPGRLSVTQV